MSTEPDRLMFPDNLRDLLSFRLNTLGKKVTLGSQKALMERHGVNMREIRILMSLQQYGRMTSSDLVEITDLDKSTISRGAKDLMRRDLVIGTVDQADLRSSVLELTAEGADIAKDCFAMSRDRMSKVLECLNTAERGQLDQLLTRLDQRVDGLNAALEVED